MNIEFLKEVIIDEQKYLFAGKNSKEVKIIDEAHNIFNKEIKKNQIIYDESIACYSSLIKDAASLIKELGIKGELNSYFIIFSYLLLNGYFSINNSFSFSSNNLKDISGYLGMDVVLGNGNCRSISEMLNKTVKKLKYDAHFVVNNLDCSYTVHQINLLVNEDNEKACLNNRLRFLEKKENYFPSGTHASVLIKNNSNYYIYDATNMFIFKVDNQLTATLYNGCGQLHIKPWGFIVYENMKYREMQTLINSIAKQKNSNFIDNEQLLYIINETLSICNKEKNIFDDFRNQNLPNIETINKQLSLK